MWRGYMVKKRTSITCFIFCITMVSCMLHTCFLFLAITPYFAVYRSGTRTRNYSNHYVVRGSSERESNTNLIQWKRIEERGTIRWSGTPNSLLSIVDITFILVESADTIVFRSFLWHDTLQIQTRPLNNKTSAYSVAMYKPKRQYSRIQISNKTS